MLCALIMAGGKGSRFWPLSTEDKPKQFLNLIGNKTMIQMTIDRIKDSVPMERIFVCTGRKYVELVKEQIPGIPTRNIIIEPEGRNTAPCIALSSLVIKRYYKDAKMVVLPADHLIQNEEGFRDIIGEAEGFLEKNREAIVTLGMKPSRPETGYGYIKESNCRYLIRNHSIVKVDAFVEKPDFELANRYLRSGSYLWNGGIFMWTVEGILSNFKKYLPSMYEVLESIGSVSEKDLQKEINNNYVMTEPISVDYGILEKADDIYVIPSNIGWDDIGSWEAIERYREKDEDGNIHMGNVTELNSSDNIIISTSKEVIIDGLSDIYVIESNGKLLIGRKSKVNKVKELKNIV